MKRYLKRLLLKEDVFKDWLFWLPLLYLFSNFVEVIYDYFDDAPYTDLIQDIFIWICISLIVSSPFFLWRYLSLKRYFQKNKPKIFISYATNDQTLVETIKSTLENNSDYEYWWQNDLKAGQNLDGEGGFSVWGKLYPAKKSVANGFLPIGLANNVKLNRAFEACKKFNPVLLDKTTKSNVIQITALRREIDNMSKNLKKFGLVSVSRTGAVAMTRGSEIFK